MAANSDEFGLVAGALVGGSGRGCFPEFEIGSEICGVMEACPVDGLFWVVVAGPSAGLLSRECVAAGVKGGDCIIATRGEAWGDVLADVVFTREAVALVVSRELTCAACCQQWS